MSRLRPELRAGFAGLLIGLAALAGCDSGTASPPPTPTQPGLGIDGLDSGPTSSGVPEVVVVLPAEEVEDLGSWEYSALDEAGRLHVLATVERPSRFDPPETQARMIVEAARRGASALIVAPPPDPGRITEALGEAAALGVPIVLLGHDVPAGTEGADRSEQRTVVSSPSLEIPVRELALATREAARDVGLPETGPALILIDGKSGEAARRRGALLHDAFEEAGIEVLPSLTFTRSQQDEEAMETVMTEHPEIAMVVFEGDNGLNLAMAYRSSRRVYARFLMAGIVGISKNVDAIHSDLAVAVLDRNSEGLARRAVRAALAMARGEAQPGRIEVESHIYRDLDPPAFQRPPGALSPRSEPGPAVEAGPSGTGGEGA